MSTNKRKGAPPRPLTKEVLLSAMEKTKSVKAMTRYLHCSYPHIKMWMKHYVDEATGKTSKNSLTHLLSPLSNLPALL